MDNTGKSKLTGLFIKFVSYISVLLFFLSFNFQDTQTGGWVRQYFPSTMNKQIQDLTFTDSTVGYAITHAQNLSDTSFLLKTSNSGFNWSIIKTEYPPHNALYKISFLNNNTGFVSCFTGTSPNIANLQKTTNGGLNWQDIYFPSYIDPSADMFVLNTDTIWVCSSRPTVEGGGLWRTTNGGLNWTIQYTPGVAGANGYAQRIYFYNRNIGYLGTDASELLKTTNCGVNWTKVYDLVNSVLTDIYFADSLKGYIANLDFYKTINGGVNWVLQSFPSIPGGNYTLKHVERFYYIHDTIYTVNSAVQYPNNQWRSVIYKSTNGGLNWGYQVPDTSFRLVNLPFVKFINGKIGWAYSSLPNYGGMHTTLGGDSTFYTSINEHITNNVPSDFILYQNYPNPFNATSNIKYKIEKTSNIKLIIFNIIGKEIATLISKKQNPGEYRTKFDGNSISSGVYFYSLFADGVRLDTKKLILLK